MTEDAAHPAAAAERDPLEPAELAGGPLKVTDEQLGIDSGYSATFFSAAPVSTLLMLRALTPRMLHPHCIQQIHNRPRCHAMLHSTHVTASMFLKLLVDVTIHGDSRAAAPEGVELDLGNLSAFDPSAPATRDEGEAKAQATALTQALMNALLQLPAETTAVGRVAALPPPKTPLPRAKPLPKPREPTKASPIQAQLSPYTTLSRTCTLALCITIESHALADC